MPFEAGLTDLHTHSTASDGALAPADLVRLAHATGVTVLALTDHDTLAGLPAAQAAADELGVHLVPGIEVSTAHPRPGTLHLLGYGFDPDSRPMRTLVRRIESARHERAALIVDRLNRAGVDLSLAELQDHIGDHTTPGRPHVASLLVKKGLAASTRDAFDRLIGSSGVAYVDNLPLGPDRVIELIRAAGGVVSLAHPLQLRRQTFPQLAAFVQELADLGLSAIETHHPTHDTDTAPSPPAPPNPSAPTSTKRPTPPPSPNPRLAAPLAERAQLRPRRRPVRTSPWEGEAPSEPPRS